MPNSQREISLQMLAQLRLLDPSASAEVGTPERKIIDTVAAALHENQIDLTLLQGQLDFNAKFGENLDRFFALFRFNRQGATFAEGFVRLGRLIPATSDIRIPAGIQVMATVEGGTVGYQTTFDVYLRAGETSVIAPVRALVAGEASNVAAGAITTFIGEPVLGITEATNEIPIEGGRNRESDEEYKVRFKNTVFRNLAGTQDQYLALALALQFSSKANVVGPLSRYREYIQVPQVDDASGYISGAVDYGSGNGIAAEYTTALSTLPYAKHIWSDVPFFVSNGDLGVGAVFYREETDFRMNITADGKYRGDAYRLFENIDPAIGDDPRVDGDRPNITFTNVYTGVNEDVEAIRPSDVVLFEYGYLSDVSRNDYDRRIFNCVDVFVDGVNLETASTVLPRPTAAHLFIDNPTSKYHYDNYRRIGEPEHRPVLGNVLTPLYWEPVTEIPEFIEVEVGDETYTYNQGIHYWLVEDISEYGGTVRARNGIEWSLGIGAAAGADPFAGPYTGPYVTELPPTTAIAIENYRFNRNVVDLQTSLEANKQVTTDVLAHHTKTRYYKLDISVMYSQGASITSTNFAIHEAVQTFLEDQFFGGIVQLSDLLQVIHNVSGVDNVRWSSDAPNQPDTFRVRETDANGIPLANVLVDQTVMASPNRGLPEQQRLIVTGDPTGGTFRLNYGENSTADLAYNIGSATLQSAINSASGVVTAVTGAGTITDPFIVDFTGTAAREVLQVSNVTFIGGPTIYTTDFALKDDELPALPEVTQEGDSVPGLIIRPRAQHTWGRL